MKVRINQAIELESVPDRVMELFEVLVSESNTISNNVHEAADASRVKSSSALKYKLLLEMVGDVKSGLSELEQSIADLESILKGYIGILTSKKASTPLPAPDADIAGPDAPDYSSLPLPTEEVP